MYIKKVGKYITEWFALLINSLFFELPENLRVARGLPRQSYLGEGRQGVSSSAISLHWEQAKAQ